MVPEQDTVKHEVSLVDDKSQIIYVKILYNFVKRKEGELTINKGDIVKVTDHHKPGWWKGELNGIVGKFPSNYCKIIEMTEDSKSDVKTVKPKAQPLKVLVMYNFTKRKESELTIKRGDIVTVREQSKSGWWKGDVNGEVGKFPSNYCKIVEDKVI